MKKIINFVALAVALSMAKMECEEGGSANLSEEQLRTLDSKINELNAQHDADQQAIAERDTTIAELRETIFRNFAASGSYGMIFTMMMDFDMPSEWAYLEHIKSIFAPYGTEFYYVELIAPQAVRLQRNATENRLRNKASKRDVAASNRRLIEDDKNHRCVSYEGEITFPNYLRVDNSDKSPEAVARMIQETFRL